MRRGIDSITSEVYWGGTVLTLVAMAAVTLAIVRHRLAPLIAVVVGFSTALLVGFSHLLPRWSAFSDSFAGSRVDILSWAAVLSEIAGALAFGAAGAYVIWGARPSDR